MGGFVPNLKTLNGRGAGGENAVTCLDEKVSEFCLIFVFWCTSSEFG